MLEEKPKLSDNARKTVAFTLDSVAEEIQQESSTPTQEPVQIEAPSPAPTADAVRDSEGVTYDPKIHATKADGSPAFAATGRFRRRRGTGPARASVIGAQPKTKVQVLADADKIRQAGITCAEILFAVCVAIGGPDWNPQTDAEKNIDERRDMRNAWITYTQIKDIKDMPPSLVLFAAITTYASPRFTESKTTKERASRALTWLKDRTSRFVLWRRRKHATQSNNRDDGKRQNDAREKASGSPAE